MKKVFLMSKKMLTDPAIRLGYMQRMGLTDFIPDRRFISMRFERALNKKLSFDAPVTFNEKLQWLKLYDRKPEYTVMVDKYAVKQYVADSIGEEYIIKNLGVWDSPDKIDFDALPESFVLKCNHNSGLGMCICRDKSKLDIFKTRKELKKGLKQDYYLTGREWPYKDVPRKIIAEPFLKSDEGGLIDYKIHCFNGAPKFVLVCCDRFSKSGLTEDFYTPTWEHMNVKRPNIPNAEKTIPKPEKLEEMLVLAEKLARNIPFVRVDFYFTDDRIYFSELTFFPASGFVSFEPEEWDNTFGEWLALPR